METAAKKGSMNDLLLRLRPPKIYADEQENGEASSCKLCLNCLIKLTKK